MQNNSNQEEQLLKFISTLAGGRVVVDAATLLFEERVLDSMNILNLMGYVEKRLGRRLRDEEVTMPNFISVRQIVAVFFNN